MKTKYRHEDYDPPIMMREDWVFLGKVLAGVLIVLLAIGLLVSLAERAATQRRAAEAVQGLVK